MHALVQGHCDRKFHGVKERFAAHLANPGEAGSGAAIVVYHGGERVIDLWGGSRDPQGQAPWQRDTPVCVFSCTKGVVSIITMRLVQAGVLGYDERVATYWPEFGAHDKHRITVRQLLSHQAGVPTLAARLAPGDVWNWSAVTSALAASTAKWPPGARHGYHALTWGYLVGGLLERASGTAMRELLQREVCDPLQVNFSFGLAAEDAARVATLVEVAPAARPGDAGEVPPPGAMTQLDEAVLLTAGAANSENWRRAVIPGANGHCSALDLATIYRGLVDSRSRYLERDVLAQATAVEVSGKDAVLKMESAYGLGFQLATAEVSPSYTGGNGCWGHKGVFGSTGFVDPEHDLVVGYVTNRCGRVEGDSRVGQLLSFLYDCL